MYCLVLNHCKNNVIHCKTNDICIAWMLSHCKNNAIHNKINDICIAWMLNHYKNKTVHCKIINKCVANHCKPNKNPQKSLQIVYHKSNNVINNCFVCILFTVQEFMQVLHCCFELDLLVQHACFKGLAVVQESVLQPMPCIFG